MSNRFAGLLVLALVLSGCDAKAGASGSADTQLGLPAVGTVAPPSQSAAGVAPSLSLPLPSASLTLPPSFTPPVPPSALPSLSLPLPTITVVLPTPAPSPSPSPTIARPTITSFVPESGPRGSIVTITGTNLAGVTLVLFGDIPTAPRSPPTATTVVAVVPLAAVNAPISVVSPAGVVTSTRFFIVEEPTAPPAPTCPIRIQCPSPTP